MRFTAIVFTFLICLTIAHGMPAADEALPGQLPNTVVVVPTVYLSTAPNLCFPLDSSQPLYLYLHAPDTPGLTSISFDLQMQGTAPDPLVFLPLSGSLTATPLGPAGAYHFEVTLGPGVYDQTPIIQPYFLSDPMLQGDQIVSNVVYNGGTPGDGRSTFAGCCIDCLNCNHVFIGPSSMQVPSGTSSTYDFQLYWHCFTSGGGAITVTDTQGWVTSWNPTGQAGSSDCGLCFWPIDEGTVNIDVPYNVADGTTSVMTIQGVSNSKNVTLEAIQPVPTEAATWGSIKALYR